MTPLESLTIGSSNATQDPKIKTNFETLSGLLGGSNKIADTGMESPNNSAYKLLMLAQSSFIVDAVAGTYLLGSASSGIQNPIASGGQIDGNSSATAPPVTFFAKADYEVAGKTQKLRLRAQVAANATKPTIKFTFGLYPITVAGEADKLNLTMGTVVSGSTVEINEPAASTLTSGTGSDFTIPSDGAFVLGVVSSGTLTNNNASIVSAQLQSRNV